MHESLNFNKAVADEDVLNTDALALLEDRTVEVLKEAAEAPIEEAPKPNAARLQLAGDKSRLGDLRFTP